MGKMAVVSVYVTDLERAAAFYTALGFPVVARPTSDIVVLGHENPTIVLCETANPAGPEYGHATGAVLGLAVSSAEKAATEARAAGGRILTAKPLPFPEGRFVAVADPSGNFVELLEFKR